MCVAVVRLTFQRANVKNIDAYRKGKKGIEKAKESQQQKTKNGEETGKGKQICPKCES